MRTFALYPEERSWWSFNDYAAVMDAVHDRALGNPFSVLEFGPGSSTLALIEGGATTIDCCEDDPVWAQTYRERLQRDYPAIVTIVDYVWANPIVIHELKGRAYDFGLVDGPLGTVRRDATIEYCMHRCATTMVCTEDQKPGDGLRATIRKLVKKHKRNVEFITTGPLAGGFAFIT